MRQDLLKSYSKRIAKEGIIKSVLISLAIGCGVLAVSMFLSWFLGFKGGLWVSIAVFALVVVALIPILYYAKFRPSQKTIAKRVDELGLDERVITMMEFEKDDSIIARKLREDTEKTLGKFSHMFIKIAVSASLIVLVGIVGFFGLAMTTVNSLYVAGAIPSGIDLLAETIGKKEFTVSYGVKEAEEETGRVVYYEEGKWVGLKDFEGEIKVKEGENAPAVIAIPKSRDYVFVEWSDGLRSPYRQDLVTTDISVTAVFALIEDEYIEDPALGGPQQKPQTAPDPNGEPEEGEDQQPPENPSQDGDGDGESNDGGGNHNSAGQQIINGETYYGDDFSSAYAEALDRLGQDGEMSDEHKDWINDYFESIDKGD